MTQQTAQGLASLGRGPDTMLVHMAPSEVAGLQALALKHGGSLTINPDTGLPEAGFLSRILPMVLGVGLAATGIGAPMAAMLVGGGYGLAKGSIKDGLMAGLGAYGGAGLAGSLMGAGTGALSSAAGAAAEIPASAIVPEAVAPTVAPDSLANAVSAPSAAAPAGMQPLAGVPGKFVTSALPQPVVPPINAAQIAPTITQAPVAASAYAPAESMGAALARDQAAAQAVGSKLATTTPMDTLGAGFKAVTASPSTALNFAKDNMYPLGAAGISALNSDEVPTPENGPGMIRPYTYSREKVPGAFEDVADAPMSSKERRYFADKYTALTPYEAPGPEYMASGGPVEDMSNANAIGMNTGYPQADIGVGAYATPYQQPISRNVVTEVQGIGVDPYTGQAQFAGGGSIDTNANQIGLFKNLLSSGGTQSGSVGGYSYDPATQTYGRTTPADQGPDSFGTVLKRILSNAGVDFGRQKGSSIGGYSYDPATQTYGQAMAAGGLSTLARGGISHLGDYSDGGRLLRGPGDGISDSIPAMIGKKQPARLADGEFVVPARIVSELGNGSTEAGARKLYAMMDRVQKARGRTVGKGKVATNSRAAKFLPA